MKKHRVVSLILMLAITSGSAWAKPRQLISVQVVRYTSDPYVLRVPVAGHPGSSTTNCTSTPSGATTTCNTQEYPAQEPSVIGLPMQTGYIYAVMPDGKHVTLESWGFMTLYYPLSPGSYDGWTDGGKVLHIHVPYYNPRNPKSPKFHWHEYRVVGTW